MSHFQTADDPRIEAARQPLFRPSKYLKQELRKAWFNLRVCVDGKEVQVCLTAACKVFACSRSFLNTTKPRKKTLADATQKAKAVDVAAWFYRLRETLDIMPDQGWYQLQHPKKMMVYEQYMLDVQSMPSMYSKVSPDFFNKTWNTNFPEVKIRKHCRFAKCEFCVHHREIIGDQKVDHTLQAESKQRLGMHFKWAQTRERGFYHKKRDEATQFPGRAISIAMDGTDQMINGFPHFWETTKKDAKGKRLTFHTQVFFF
jgi:hypothetical protein